MHQRQFALLAALILAGVGCDVVRQSQSPTTAAGQLDTCTLCHGEVANGNAAPPRSTTSATATTDPRVGAHQAHLQDGPLRKAVACGDCHLVPATVDSPGHMDGVVEVTFGALAHSDGAQPSWDPAQVTCATYCHGSTLPGGSNTAPIWNKVDGTQAACGTCHGIPPSSGHHSTHQGQGIACGNCHGTAYSATTVDVSLHVNGTIDVGNKVTSWSPTTHQCVGCHGSATW